MYSGFLDTVETLVAGLLPTKSSFEGVLTLLFDVQFFLPSNDIYEHYLIASSIGLISVQEVITMEKRSKL